MALRDRVSHGHYHAPDVGFVAGVDGALGAALVEHAQNPAPVALDEEPDDGFPAATGIADRDQAAVRGALVGVDPHVVIHSHARGNGVLRAAHDGRLAAEHRPLGSEPRRRGRARGSRNKVWGGRYTSALAPPAHSGAPLDAGAGPPAMNGRHRPTCLHYNDAGGGYLRWAPLIAESEWGTMQEVFDDFEKLLVARAGVRVLVFDLRRNWKTMDRAATELSRSVTAFDATDCGDAYLLTGWTPSGFEYLVLDGMAARDGALSTLA